MTNQKRRGRFSLLRRYAMKDKSPSSLCYEGLKRRKKGKWAEGGASVLPIGETSFDFAERMIPFQNEMRIVELAMEGDLLVAGVEILGLEEFEDGGPMSCPQEIGHGRAVKSSDGRCGAQGADLFKDGQGAAVDNVISLRDELRLNLRAVVR